MKIKFLLPVMFAIAVNSNAQIANVNYMTKYPETFKDNTVDNYFGTQVADPYRWLEYDTADNVAHWVKQQNQVTEKYLANIPYRNDIKDRLSKIWNYPKYSAPFKQGKYIFFSKNNGLQNQSVLYYQISENAEPLVFLDPNKLSGDGTSALASFSVSKDNKYAAYGVAKSGSDWNEIFIMEVETKKQLTDHLKWVKFGGAVWHKDGFYYCRYDEPVKGKEFSNQNQYQKIYYHKIGSKQEQDVLVYEDKKHPLRYFRPQVTEDSRYLIINASEGTSGDEIWAKDLTQPESIFKLIAKGFENNYHVVDNVNDKLMLLTDLNAPKYRLVLVDPNAPEPANWKDVIKQGNHLLEYVHTGGGKLFAGYLQDASSRVYQYNLQGTLEHEIKLPGIGTASGFGSKKGETNFYYSFTSFTNPGSIYKYNIATGESKLFRKSEIAVDLNKFETKQVFYTSNDGTLVPMFIIHKKDLVLDGNNPTLLYGYGGFNINLTPSFSVSRLLFLEQGGVYCIANLRGGGEYGEDWHKAGMLNRKQNVFDDFISGAEYLIRENYTNPQRLAIQGGSNGGLLVGACITQRPELFKVALPAVGVLDMLRYHKFTIGWGWAVEYGTSENKEQFDYLIKYSPLHNVKPAPYPATMVLTADHDDRVVPAHSFKFLATLQEFHQGENPVIGRIDSKAGHGAGKPTTKLIEEAADIWSFVLWNFDVKELK